MSWGHRTRILAVVALALASSACSDKEADHFLEALKRADYDAAFADLHADARASTPNAVALRARMMESGVDLVGIKWTCGSTSTSLARSGYDVTTRAVASKPRVPVFVGTFPQRRGKCNAPLVIELKRDASVTGKPWKVAGMKLD